MTFELPALPYPVEALEPHISARTFEYHHGKHHQAYVTNLNNLIKDTPLAVLSLEEIIKQTAKDDSKTSVFNNAAQVWNHSFFWNCLSPRGGGDPTPDVLQRMVSSFGSLEAFKEEFKQAGITQFGAGWVWLVEEEGKLKVVKTANAMTPLVVGQKPIVTCDVWEHAYYLDYQNRRPDFLQVFSEYLINWDFVAKNMG